jgi:D-alanyl-D-alanine carboxypeptidase/D-alanyl-D-alanine-endopeptidase (penicillin-binding protein 4)
VGRNRSDALPEPAAVAQLNKVAEFTSPPMAEHARLILKVSHNLHASELPLLVAVKNGKRTLADGLKLQHAFFAKAGIDGSSVSFGGGAGGARADHVTPRATVQLLRYMAEHKAFAAYKAGLPVLGVDGTLAKTVAPNSPARGKAFAKTGTLVWDNTGGGGVILTSKALAGYLTAANGRELAFAVFVNNVPLGDGDSARRTGETLGKLCEAIHGAAPK